MGAFSLIVVINLLNRAYGQVPTCTEGCPEGFEKVHGLAHCYKLLVDLGPVSHDKATAACGYEKGATLVTFDNDGDEQILRDHMWAKYGDELKSKVTFDEAQGYWTGYVRYYGNPGYPFVNMYSGVKINPDLFSPNQPNNLLLGEYGEEACLARKKIGKFYVHKRKPHQGLDDYTCGFPHNVICMHRDIYALNQQAYNTALMNNTVTLPADGTCRLDWPTQNHYTLYMMRLRRIEYNNDWDLADWYKDTLMDKIRTPVCGAVSTYQNENSNPTML